MRFIKISALALVAALSIGQGAYAKPAKPGHPTECPKVADIISAGVEDVLVDEGEGIYAVAQLNSYNTPYNWGFAILVNFDQASSADDAVTKAQSALLTLNGTPTPMPLDATHDLCYYNIGNDFIAAALTPVDFMNSLPRYMMRK